MKYKDTIAFYNDRRNNSKASIERRYPNCPTLTIADDELTTAIGQWLGEIPLTSNEISKKKKDTDSYLTPSYLLRKKMVTERDLFLVTKRFANILRMIGISEDNICFLDNFKRPELKELSFDCYLYDTEEVIKIKLNFMTWLNCPELIVERNGITTEYEHWYCKHNEPDRLGLQAVKKELGNERNVFYYTGHEEFHGELVDKENKFTIDIEYPTTYESTDIDNPFVDYTKIEQVLSSISFPTDVETLRDEFVSCLKMDVSKYEISLKALCNGNELTYSFPERVKIYDEHKELALTIGDWMEAHSPISRTLMPSINTRKDILTSRGIKEISRHFTEILKLTGLNINNKCELLGFNKDDLSFECILEDESVAKIKLILSTEEESDKIAIEYNGILQVFNYYKGYEMDDEVVPDRLYLNYIDKEVDCCGTRFRHDYDDYIYYGKAYDDKGRLEVTLYYPGNLTDYYPENPFVDEEKLEEIISTNCEFPVDITHIYRSVFNCIKQSPMSVTINIKAIKYVDGKEYVTDAILCRGSYVSEFTITKRWRTITVKQTGAWDYDSAEWKVSQNMNKQISYTLKDIISDESKLDECPTPSSVYKEAKEEAEQVRRLVKSLVQSEK